MSTLPVLSLRPPPSRTALPPAGLRAAVLKWAAVLLVPTFLCVVGWWTHSSVEQAMKQDLADGLRTILDADVEALTLWLESQKSNTLIMANEPVVRTEATRLLALSRREGMSPEELLRSEPLRQLRQTLDPVCKQQGLIGFAVLRLDGEIVGSSFDVLVGKHSPLGSTPGFLDPLREGKTLVSHPVRSYIPLASDQESAGRNRPTIIVLAPLRDDDEKIEGALAFRIEPEGEFTRILSVGRPGKTGETYAFDARGVMLSESRFTPDLKKVGLLPDRDGASAILNLDLRDPGVDLTTGAGPALSRDRQPLTLMARAAVADKGDGVNVDGYRDYRGIEVIGAWTWLPDYDFGVATEVDAAEAFKPLVLLERVFWGLFGLLLVAGGGVLVSTFVIGALRRQVRRAEHQALRLGQYTLQEKLGTGGMGEVYKASHALLRRPTAIKLLRPESSSEEAIARFEREVQFTSRLSHPNTIAIYDFGRTAEGVFYYVMEYLDGLTLDDLVAQEGPQPAGRVIHLLLQACASLEEAHGRGLIHRDIKPANLMLCRHGGQYDVIKVLDFGIVKEVGSPVEDLSLTGNAPIGTPQYIAPEALRAGARVDARRDIYALGAVGYFLLTAKPVFEGGSVVEICNHHLRTPPVPPSVRSGLAVPSNLEGVILHCLEKDPDARPRNVADLAAALAACGEAGHWGKEEARVWWAERGDVILAARAVAEGSSPLPDLTVDLNHRDFLDPGTRTA